MWSAEWCCIALFREPIKWLVFYAQTRFHFACRSVSYFSVSEHLFHKSYCKEKEKYTKGRRERFLEEETVRTTRRNGKEGDVWKMGRSQLLAFKQNAGAKFLCGLVSHVQKIFPYSYVLQPSWSSIQQTHRPKVSSFNSWRGWNLIASFTIMHSS